MPQESINAQRNLTLIFLCLLTYLLL